jgi:hypothetical protein
MRSLGTRRFLAFVCGLSSILAITIAAMLLGVRVSSIDSALTIVCTLTLGYVGAGAWHDRGVRIEQTRSEAKQ